MTNQTILATSSIAIPFVYMTRRYGRAEFDLCFRKRKNWFFRCHIIPRQQPGVEYDYYVQKKFRRFSIAGYDKLEDPKVWSGNACPQHNGFNLSVYVPDGSSVLRVEFGSDELRFIFLRRNLK